VENREDPAELGFQRKCRYRAEDQACHQDYEADPNAAKMIR
jgi:hypothetical protein